MIRPINGNITGLMGFRGTAKSFMSKWFEYKFGTMGLPERFWEEARAIYSEQRARGNDLSPDDLVAFVVETYYPKCAGCGERDDSRNLTVTCGQCGEYAHPHCTRVSRRQLICDTCAYTQDCYAEAWAGRSV